MYCRFIIPFVVFMFSTGLHAQECVDTDPLGNGWGWDGSSSCRVDQNTNADSSNTNNHSGTVCIDTAPFGNGWGWDGSASCRVGENTGNTNNNNGAFCIDTVPLGNGWGWNGSSSCRVGETTSNTNTNINNGAVCIDTVPLGNGWGWNGSASCRVGETTSTDNNNSNNNNNAVCIDTVPLGNGWGWDGSSSCRVEQATNNEDGGENPTAEVVPLPASVISRLSPDTNFYKQYLDVGGVPILSSSRVSPYALLETRWVIENMMINRADVLQAISGTNTRLAIMATDEFTTDIPEHADLTPADYWDRRARGLGASTQRPAMSAGEENILQLNGDPYSTESILVHEFAHVIHLQGMNNLESGFQATLDSLYAQALSEGLWQGTYAATNAAEYFAEGVQSWFGTNRENDSQHNFVNTRGELMSYDPRFAALLFQIFGDNTWMYAGPADRQDDTEHLSGFDRQSAGAFSWPAHLANIDISAGPGVDLSLPELQSVQGEDWSGISSPAVGGPATLTFFNASNVVVSLQWIDFQGQRVEYGILSPGGSIVQSTFEGHLWELVDISDQTVVAQFRVAAGDNLAVVD